MAARVSGSSYFHLSSSVSFIGFYLEERKEEKKTEMFFFLVFRSFDSFFVWDFLGKENKAVMRRETHELFQCEKTC